MASHTLESPQVPDTCYQLITMDEAYGQVWYVASAGSLTTCAHCGNNFKTMLWHEWSRIVKKMRWNPRSTEHNRNNVPSFPQVWRNLIVRHNGICKPVEGWVGTPDPDYAGMLPQEARDSFIFNWFGTR